MLSENNDYKIMVDLICLVLSLFTLIIRLQLPLFKQNLVRKVVFMKEVGRFWITLLVVLKKAFSVDSTPLSLVIEILLCLILVRLFVTLVDWRLDRFLDQGLKKLKNYSHLEAYLSEMYSLISLDSK
jgi:tellurite resistance protein TehA-like permease